MPTHDEFIEIANHRLHVRRIGEDTNSVPLVFLHEGLGSVDLWRSFPEDVVADSDHPALVYSRPGYGWSDPVRRPRTPDYMHQEAQDVLPQVLAGQGIAAPILVGHSDGASISIIYAGSGHPVNALVLIAPHVFVEDGGLASIAAVSESFPTSGLSQRMARYHHDPESTFRGWADVWLDPDFRSWNIEEHLDGIDCPILLVQCEEDEYGSLGQLDAIEDRVRGPVQRLVLPGPGHSPHLHHPELVTDATVAFLRSLG